MGGLSRRRGRLLLSCVAIGLVVIIGGSTRAESLQGAASNTSATWVSFGDDAATPVQSDVFFLSNVESDGTTQVTAGIVVKGQTWTLDLQSYSIRSKSFQVWTGAGHDGQLSPVEVPPAPTYRGRVVELPGSIVAARFAEGQLQAIIFTENATYGVEPVQPHGKTHDRTLHAVYRASDSDWMGDSTCATEAEHVIQSYEPGGDIGAGDTAGVLQIAEVGLDADYEYFVRNDSDVTATVQDMETVMNAVAAKYEVEQIGVTFELTTVVVRTSPSQPYTETSSSLLLQQLRSTWNSAPEVSIHRDAAHLFTGKNIDGSIIGIAYVGVICSPSVSYGVSQSQYTTYFAGRVGLTAHELGHNFSAAHCNGGTDCGIMCSIIGGCSGSLNVFGSSSTGQIAGFASTRTCLHDAGAPQAPPFLDEFEESSMDAERWTFDEGVQVSDEAVDPPSPPFAAAIGTFANAPFGGGDFRSASISLSGQSEVVLSYWVQADDATDGSILAVQYMTHESTWAQLEELTSADIGETRFRPRAHVLPADALHGGFRIRFHAQNMNGGRWFVDDVSVGINVSPIVTSQPSEVSVCEGGSATLVLSAVGSSGLNYQWRFNGNDIEGATGADLVVDATDTNVVGVYTCLISNAFGQEVTEPIQLTVIEAGSCDDGDFCNGLELCANGMCQDGEAPCDDPSQPMCDETANTCRECLEDQHCNDGISCTVDACDPSTYTCIHTVDHTVCDDDLYCNGVEWCDVDQGCTSGDPPDCADDVDCTIDSCDETIDACNHAASDAYCDDAFPCNGSETCDSEFGCQSGSPLDCDDLDPCTDDVCDAQTGCAHISVDCGDDNVCTEDACNASTGECEHVWAIGCCLESTDCPPEMVCDTLFHSCMPPCTNADVCNDQNLCTNDTCVDGECVRTPNHANCNDDDACTTDDVCDLGICVGLPIPDADADGICDTQDNCPLTFNPAQVDTDANGVGNACEVVSPPPPAPAPPPPIVSQAPSPGQPDDSLDEQGAWTADIADADGIIVATVTLFDEPPGASVTYETSSVGADAWGGFAHDRGLRRRLTLETTASPGSLIATVMMIIDRREFILSDGDAQDMELHALDVSVDPPLWIPAGANLGESKSTNIVGESGYYLDDVGRWVFWATRDRLGTFAVGVASSPSDDEPQAPFGIEPSAEIDEDENIVPAQLDEIDIDSNDEDADAAADSDLDGIPDANDACPLSRLNTPVDALGCSIEPADLTGALSPAEVTSSAPCGAFGMMALGLMMAGFCGLRTRVAIPSYRPERRPSPNPLSRPV